MYRIGIVGTENSHAMEFAKLFNGKTDGYGDELADMRVVAVGGNYPEESAKVASTCDVDFIAENPTDMLGKIDAVMVTARDGKYHADFARPFVEAGLPAFIDKPFTRDPIQAVELARLAKSRGVPLVGGSSVKLSPNVTALRDYVCAHRAELLTGDVASPVKMVNDYGNFDFYSSHLIESLLTVFGYSPEWVWANEINGSVAATVHYPDFNVTGHFLDNTNLYCGTVFTRGGIMHTDISLDKVYALECRSFAKMLRTGKSDASYEQLVAPVFLIDAIRRSIETGEKQRVLPVEI